MTDSVACIAGADGYRGGWIVIEEVGDELKAWIAATIAVAAERVPAGTVLALDVPIGIPERGDRGCCLAARKFLGRPRASSVFPVPIRVCLPAVTYEEASNSQRERDGRGLTRQALGILTKIREVDRYLRAAPPARIQLHDVHSEVSFAVWAGRPMQHRKAKAEGRAERTALIDRFWPERRAELWSSLAGDLHHDDLNDAFAALWSARRIAKQGARDFWPGLGA